MELLYSNTRIYSLVVGFSSHFEEQGYLQLTLLAPGATTGVTADDRPWVLEQLGARSVLDCVIENALQAVHPEDIWHGCQPAA